MRFAVVLFDVGETLVGPRASFGAVYADVLRPMGIELPPEVFESELRRTWAAMSRRIPVGADRYGHFPGGEQEFWLRFARETIERATGSPPSPAVSDEALDRLRQAFAEPGAWTVYPDVHHTLSDLRRLGIRLGVVSNWDSRLPMLLGRLGLDHYFDAVLVSHLEGVEKPNPEIFLRALRAMKVRPEQSLHVGDLPDLDAAGARAAGIAARLVDRHGRLGEEHDAWPDLSPLAAWVESGEAVEAMGQRAGRRGAEGAW